MIRSSAIISFAVSLLLWSGQVLSSEPQAVTPQGCDNGATLYPCPDNSNAASPVLCRMHGRNCPNVVHRHAAGQPCPLAHGLGQRLGKNDGRPSICPIWATPPIPMLPPPNRGFFGTLGTPKQYPYPPMTAVHPGAQPVAVEQPGTQDYPGYVMPPANERIVYIPYAMPPPITVERLAKALPIPKPITLRRILGDANMYEYPEMPLHLYTTRGPRDFLAPNPPGIGE